MAEVKEPDSDSLRTLNGEIDVDVDAEKKEVKQNQSNGTDYSNETETVVSEKVTLVKVESKKDLDSTMDGPMDNSVNNMCDPGTDNDQRDSTVPLLVNGNGLETVDVDSSNTKENNDETVTTTPDAAGIETVTTTPDTTSSTSEDQGNAVAVEDIEAIEDSKGSEKQDINGNSASEQDNNLACEKEVSSTTTLNQETEAPADNEISKTPVSIQNAEAPTSNGATPITRQTSAPSNLPLAGTGSRKNSRKSSPVSPTQKTISEQRRKPAAPVSTRNGETKGGMVTPKKGEKSPNGENKFVLKRKVSKSKLPVSSPSSPSSPDVVRAKAPASEPKPDDKQTPRKKSPSPIQSEGRSPIPTSMLSATSSEGTSVDPAKSDSFVTSTPAKLTREAHHPAPQLPEITPQKEVVQQKRESARDRLKDDEETWKEKVKQFQKLKMAMSEVALDSKSRFLRCLFCTNLFSLNGREPRMLVCCLNAICTACASKLCLESPLHLRCPVCRQNISLPQDRTSDSIDLTDESVVDGGQMELPTEVLRTKIIEFQHIQKGLTFPCSYCTGKTLCTWFCENCDSYMCDQCRDGHKEDTKSKRHSTIAIPTLKSRQLKDFKHHHFCKEHNFSKLTLYCTTCKRVVCSICTRDGHERETHTVITIQEAFGVRIKQAGKLLSKAKKKHRHLTEYSKSLKAKSDCNDVSSSSARDHINETFDHLMDIMQHRRTELLAEVERDSSTLSTTATVDTDSADCRLSMINTASDYAKECTAKANTVEFLQLFPTVTNTLRHVLDFTNDSVNTSRQGVVFSPWNLHLIETMMKTAGQLKVVTYKPTGRPGREEVNLKPPLHPEGHDLDTTTTISDLAQDGGTRDVISCPKNRVIMIPATKNRGHIAVNCPRLEFDLQTVHSDRTITHEGAMINHAPERPLPNTGCRLRSYPGAMADTALDGTGFHLWIVRLKIAVKQRVPDNKMLFEAALTGTPVDAPLSQRIDSSLVLAGCDLHHELCIKIKYCCKNLAHFSGCKNAAGSHADFRFGMLLDFDRRRLHVLDLTANTVICKADRINVHKPLWSMFCVGRFTFADVKMNLDTADKVKVTPELFKLLTQVVDQERSK